MDLVGHSLQTLYLNLTGQLQLETYIIFQSNTPFHALKIKATESMDVTEVTGGELVNLLWIKEVFLKRQLFHMKLMIIIAIKSLILKKLKLNH